MKTNSNPNPLPPRALLHPHPPLNAMLDTIMQNWTFHARPPLPAQKMKPQEADAEEEDPSSEEDEEMHPQQSRSNPSKPTPSNPNHASLSGRNNSEFEGGSNESPQISDSEDPTTETMTEGSGKNVTKWTEKEDQLLKLGVKRYGDHDWKSVAHVVGTRDAGELAHILFLQSSITIMCNQRNACSVG